ncbi:MAG TPA: class I poly(R)-hydroxyalkanoic acid synthase [Rhizobiales bacterium]|nr:poly-beta-hydroxybutyrate polymerase [bacterium BMS3Bbin10]HDO52470.1 class I poly(R)-hydroxyalkanoic acid synthase [Hyphomicrobiales bacterium]
MTEKRTQDQDRAENKDTPQPPFTDPRELARNLARFLEQGGKVVRSLAARSKENAGPYSTSSEISEATKVLGQVARQWVNEPVKLVGAQGKLLQGYADLWGRSLRRFLGEEVEPVVKPDPGDGRFKDPDWSESQFFDFWKQAYLLTARWAEEMVEDTEGLDEEDRRKAEFYVNQISSALSPSNFALTNPEVIRETLASNGENLVNGMAQLAADLQESKDLLRIHQTDLEAFEVGRNLAVTPGKVVFQNDIIQLIQYAPATETVYEIPLLIVPPWINKYYILDLVQEKSFIAWAVAQGFTVFVVSWVNPGESLSAKTFEDYMKEGVLEAVSAVQKATGQKKINALGYCVGGTLLAATLAYMAAKGDDRIASATFLAAQVDFSEAGDLLVFIDDAQLKALEEMMAEFGYLDGSRMAAVFNMLRPRDLIWPYVVNNYLLGKQPLPFDLLYWNSDSTRMPAANHIFYLREFYLENKLAKGEMELGGERLQLNKIDVPIYEMATREDHIAPAESVFKGAKLFSGPVRFVLAGSGHIAGVVNPPARNKYQHWTGIKPSSKKHPTATLRDWLKNAKEHPGSWWPDWGKWLAKRSGDKIPARQPGDGELKPIEDAPGSYVKMRYS